MWVILLAHSISLTYLLDVKSMHYNSIKIKVICVYFSSNIVAALIMVHEPMTSYGCFG